MSKQTSQSIASLRTFKINESILWTEQEGAFKNLGQKWVHEKKKSQLDRSHSGVKFLRGPLRVMEKVVSEGKMAKKNTKKLHVDEH